MAATRSAAEHQIAVDGDTARLFLREIVGGTGGGGHVEPVIVVHGGPDFDHRYLVPELDVLADVARLVYFDQRGRGRSYGGEASSGVSIDTEVDDLDRVRAHLGVESVTVLGHSWGGVVAMEYATRRPDRTSRLILLGTAPASHAGARRFREELARRRPPEQAEAMAAVRHSAAYLAGDVDADLAFYRLHFASALPDPEQLERLLGRLRTSWTAAGVLAARAIEERLYAQTWDVEGYDLLPQLARLAIPTLIVHGERDLVPVSIAREIADAMPVSRLVVLAEHGHFAYLEDPALVRGVVAEFLAAT